MIYLGKNQMYFRSYDDCGYGTVFIEDNELVIVDRLSEYDNVVGNVMTLSEFVGVPFPMSLYEVFSYFFDGDIRSDFDMIHAIFVAFKTGIECFCFKVSNTFCWFSYFDSVKVIGSTSFLGEYNLYTVGRFIKQLRFLAAQYNSRIVRYYSDDDFFDSLSNVSSLTNLLWGYSPKDACFLMSSSLTIRNSVDASALVSTLSGIEGVENGQLLMTKSFVKDFSSCTSAIVGTQGCEYGLIIDCEGKTGLDGHLNNGFRELGGLIWCRKGKILVSIDEFFCDEVMFERVFSQVLRNLSSFSGRQRRVKILSFGDSDSKMFWASAHKVGGGFYRRLHQLINFVDCKGYIGNHTVISSLSDVAASLNVKTILPKHVAVNDAKTLLNVLAILLYRDGEFVG